MNGFEFFDYRESCKLANEVSNLVNSCSAKIENVIKVFNSTDDMVTFMKSCIGYWADAKYYDGRNRFAVLASKKIMEHNPNFATDNTDLVDENLLLNAYGFATREHRYLQNEFFKMILKYLKDDEDIIWFNEQEFIINSTDEMVPYAEYKKSLYF